MRRNAADQRAMRLEIDSRRISKITLSRSAASGARATSKKTAAVRCCGASRRMAALRRSNRSRVGLSGQLGLDGVSDACHELAGAAGQRDGSVGSRSDAVFFGLRKVMVTTTRRQSRRTASARRRLFNSRKTARPAAWPRWRGSFPRIPSEPGAGPKSNSRRVRFGSAMVVGDGVPSIRRGRWRKAVLWVPCRSRRPRLCLAGVPVCAGHGAVRFRGWRAGGEAHTQGTLLAGCCRPWPRVWSGRAPSAFGCSAQCFPASETGWPAAPCRDRCVGGFPHS
ncbi:hypothetical protein TcCL_NonESM11684 [Trypanosoma cruzi]|nr:hypothetical protein TcCL_NonESM11684 [Trypanosoma cruzi]